MSARPPAKVFGMQIAVDPKIIVGVLIALAVLIFWYNTRSGDDNVPAPAVRRGSAEPIVAARPAIVRSRHAQIVNDRGTLRLRSIDPTRGDVDPTLRLDLLARLQNVQLASAGKSLFEIGPAPLTPEEKNLLAHAPKVPPHPPASPIPTGPIVPVEQPLNIPLKYYGFVRSGQKNQGNAGLFLDGDTVVIGSEGELVMKRYLVVALTPTSARLEDPQLKKGQTLPVIPAATP